MNRGLILRAFRETWPTTLLVALLLFGVEFALGYILPKFGSQMSEQWLRMPFLKGIIQAMLGSEVGDRMGPQMFQSMAWVHPVPLALTWAHAIMLCTRVPAGEVDRGTADVLLSLPVSRWEVFFSESLVWVLSGVLILAAAFVGNTGGGLSLPPGVSKPDSARLFIVLVNLLCLYFAVGGFAWLISAFSDRRGRAMTTVFIILLASFLLNYLAQFWEPIEKAVFLSPLHYHRPVYVFGNGEWPVRDLVVLIASGAAFWLIGGTVFARRDLCTV